MHLHRIYLQGLRSPGGDHELLLHPGYNVVVSADPKQRDGLFGFLRGALYPAEIGARLAWAELGGRGRATIEIEADGIGYRLVVDFEPRRIELHRYDLMARDHRILADQPAEVDARLSSFGRPPLSIFEAVYSFGRDLPEGEHDASPSLSNAGRTEAEPSVFEAQEVIPADVHVAADGAGPLAGLGDSDGHAREELRRLEREEEEAASQLETQARLAPLADDPGLLSTLRRFRELSIERSTQVTSLASQREELDAQQAQVRTPLKAKRTWVRVGVSVGLLGAGGGLWVSWGFGLLAAGGVSLALWALLRMRALRKRAQRVQARVSALAVHEQMLDRSFELEVGAVPGLLADFKFDRVEQLEASLRAYHELRSRHETLLRELGDARAVLPEGEQLEPGVRERPSRAPRRESLAEASLPDTSVADFPGPLSTLVLIANWLGIGESELAAGLVPSLERYLRELSEGQIVGAGFRNGEWTLRARSDANPQLLGAASAELRASFEAALRCALVEALAPKLHAPILVDFDRFTGLDESSARAYSQALAALAAQVQVVQVAPVQGPWVELANALHPV